MWQRLEYRFSLFWAPHRETGEEDEVKCVSPLKPSLSSWLLLNLKGFLCLPGTKACRVTWWPTGTDWQRERKRGKVDGVKVSEFKKWKEEKRTKKKENGHVEEWDGDKVQISVIQSHGVGICGTFSVNRVSMKCASVCVKRWHVVYFKQLQNLLI